MIERDERLTSRYASAVHGASLRPVAEPVVGAAEELDSVESAEAVATRSEVESDGRGGRRVAVGLAVLVTVGLLVAGGWVLLKFADGPVKATASSGSAAAQASTSPTPTTNQLAGLNFDMTYPSLFDQVGQLKNDAQSLEQYNISSKKDYRRVMAVNVRTLTSGLLDDDSSYKWRSIHPEMYSLRTDKLHGEPVAVLSKTDGTEVTLFWAHQGKLLTIAMTSSNPDDVISDFMKAVEPTLRWRA